MKKILPLFCILFFMVSGLKLNSQMLKPSSPSNVHELTKPFSFGNDVTIHNWPQRDQRMVKICSAYNGWLFAALTYDSISKTRVLIKKSIDNGVTWTKFQDLLIGDPNEVIPSLDIITVGNSTTNLKVIMGLIFWDTIWHTGGISVPTFNGLTGNFEGNLFMFQGGPYITDVALASDYLYPAMGSSPGSIAVLYKQSFIYDSLYLKTSNDGGNFLDHQVTITGTASSIHNLSISYGRSSSWSSGRYYVAWEETTSSGSMPHIYTAHSEPNFNSPFTKPKCLDSLNASWINQCTNPVIACQSSNYDNVYGNFSEVVLFEKANPQPIDYDIVGCYNAQAASTLNFQPFIITETVSNEIQPDICFNPFDSSFIVTYFNSMDQKLPFLKHEFNMQLPQQWSTLHPGYNDDPNMVNPIPKLSINSIMQQGVSVWTKEGTNGKGVAMFDAPYITYVGTNDQNSFNTNMVVNVFPNPCSSVICFQVALQKDANISITITDLTGKLVISVAPQKYSKGKQTLELNISDLLPGSYFYVLNTSDFNSKGKFIIIRN